MTHPLPGLTLLGLLLAPAALAAQAGNVNLMSGPRFDGGDRFPSVGVELQLGPRPWSVKAAAQFHAGFPPGDGPDVEGDLGAVWIWERSPLGLYPYLGAGGAIISRHFNWGNIANEAAYAHAGVILRRGTNGNFGIDVRFLTGPMRDRLDGTFERVRYLQFSGLIGWGW